MLKRFKRWLKYSVDYDIVSSYLNTTGNGRYDVKHNRKYYVKIKKVKIPISASIARLVKNIKTN